MKLLKHISLGLVAGITLGFTASSMAGGHGGMVKDKVVVDDPYVRAVPPGQPNSAAFMVLKNTSNKATAVVNAKSDVSKVVELHTHTHENGMMKMRRIPQIDLAANSDTQLKPGGLHVMLIGLKQDLKVGQKVDIELEFADGSKTAISAPVRKINMGMMKKGMMKH